MRFGHFHLLALGLALVAGGGATIYLFSEPEAPRRQAELAGNAQRGAYVLRMAGCVSCHTNTKEGGAFLAGGAPINSPFGSFHPPNITPHATKGIGAWSQEDFFAAMTHGKSPQGVSYYPSFPYVFYTRMSDQDIADLWAALRQVAPAAGIEGEHKLRWPLSMRVLLRPWRRLFFDSGALGEAAGSQEWQRGRYIVEGPGHCGSCHTPRNLFGALKQGRALAGGHIGKERAPAITAAALREDGWEVEDIVLALKTGLTPEGDVFGGSMGEVVRDNSSHFTEADLRAIATYLLLEQEGGFLWWTQQDSE